jgi:predicted metal-dependent hydrolase
MVGLWADWLTYFKPGFHPWDQDNIHLLEEWMHEYATSPVYRKAS